MTGNFEAAVFLVLTGKGRFGEVPRSAAPAGAEVGLFSFSYDGSDAVHFAAGQKPPPEMAKDYDW